MTSAAGPALEDEIVLIPYTVEPNYAGWRLDRYLCEKLRRASRERVQEIIENDLVCERPMKASSLVWPGLTFRLRRRVRAEPTVPGPEQLGEVFADDWLLVVAKPAGLPMHPTARYHLGTLVTQLDARYGKGRASPAHRLDRETSGLVVCGRTLEATQRLGRLFHDGLVDKEYLALVEGHPADDTFDVDAPIAEGTELIRIAVRIDRAVGRPAQTHFRVVARFERRGEPFSLLRAFPRTGRQHQIRVHAREAGFPLVGDKMYGPDPGYFDRFSRRELEPEAWARLRLDRHALHAARLSLRHPGTREVVSFDAPLPADLRAFMQSE
ncbi:MAG: RluA family pseudouridine synthase [Myxococcaceae bacterium]|jgi:23S rRNA pseudouridine1911/1915/1917 synthase|nr:RluA family pseudouridine synthase [Myxococcaceae bacterium]